MSWFFFFFCFSFFVFLLLLLMFIKMHQHCHLQEMRVHHRVLPGAETLKIKMKMMSQKLFFCTLKRENNPRRTDGWFGRCAVSPVLCVVLSLLKRLDFSSLLQFYPRSKRTIRAKNLHPLYNHVISYCLGSLMIIKWLKTHIRKFSDFLLSLISKVSRKSTVFDQIIIL